DISEKKKLLLKCILLYVGCILLLILLSTTFTASHFHHWTIAMMICIVIGATGAIRAFSGPTFGSIISQIVPKEILSSAASISSATWLIGSITGHAAAGFLIAFIGINKTFIVILCCIVAGYFFLSKLSVKPAFASAAKNTWHSVKEGLDYVFKTKEL